MPYFEDDNLLFVHIPKNAGKSIEVALGLANQSMMGEIGRRSVINRAFTFAQRATSNRVSRKKLHGTLDYAYCSQHLTLQEILHLDLIPKIQKTSLRSFAVFREPLERVVSTFMHFQGNRHSSKKDFERFCDSWYAEESLDHNITAHRKQQIDYILDCRGRVGVNRVILFQTLADEFSNLCIEWGLRSRPLPHIGGQTDQSLIEGLYTDKAKKMIRMHFADDIEFYSSLILKR